MLLYTAPHYVFSCILNLSKVYITMFSIVDAICEYYLLSLWILFIFFFNTIDLLGKYCSNTKVILFVNIIGSFVNTISFLIEYSYLYVCRFMTLSYGNRCGHGLPLQQWCKKSVYLGSFVCTVNLCAHWCIIGLDVLGGVL